jgi:hypothetical protein
MPLPEGIKPIPKPVLDDEGRRKYLARASEELLLGVSAT